MTLSELGAFIAVLVSLYSILSQRHYVASQTAQNLAQSESTNVKDALELKAQYRSDFIELRADLDAERECRLELEQELREEKTARMELQQRIAFLEKEREELEAGIARLISQIIYLGYIPDWQPRTGPLKPKSESTS